MSAPSPDIIVLEDWFFNECTTAQRLALPVGLSNKYLPVYDTTLGKRYTWDGTMWIETEIISSAGVGTVLSVSGTAGRITSTGGANPIINIDPLYIGQSSITTLGTIGTGVWQGTAITSPYLNITGNFSFNNFQLTNLADGTVSHHAINLGQLTAAVEGRKLKDPVKYTTTGYVALTGLGVQANGEWLSPLTAGDRILVKANPLSEEDGIYIAAAGAWARSLDTDTGLEITDASTYVLNGASTGKTFSQSLTVTTIGVDPQNWIITGDAILYTADGTSLTLTGTQFSRNALTGDVTAPAGSSVTTLATVNSNVGSFGSATQVMTQTVNAKGLTTAAANVSIQIAESQVTNLVTDLATKVTEGDAFLYALIF